MTDLFDIAKAPRDVAMTAIRSHFDQHPPHLQDGARLGTHLACVLIAFTAERHNCVRGPVTDHDLLPVLSLALADALTHCAMNFRPVMAGGKQMPPSALAQLLLSMVTRDTLAKVATFEAGLGEFTIPFDRAADGSLQPQPFDFQDHMKGKP